MADGEILPVFVICGDSDNFLLWLRRVWIQFSLKTSGKAHPTMPALAGPPMQQAAECWSQLLIHQSDNEEFRTPWAEDNMKEKKMNPLYSLLWLCMNSPYYLLTLHLLHYQAISWNIISLLILLVEHFTLFRLFDSICKGMIKKHFICAVKWESKARSCKQAALLSQIYTLILSMELILFFTSQEKIHFTLMHSNLCTTPTHFLCFQPRPSGKFLWEINMGINSLLRFQKYLIG